MQPFKFELISFRARLAGAVFAVVCSVASFAAVFVVFASASGELDPVLARIKAAPPASAVVSAAPVKRVRN
jgi:hypothetical protein